MTTIENYRGFEITKSTVKNGWFVTKCGEICGQTVEEVKFDIDDWFNTPHVAKYKNVYGVYVGNVIITQHKTQEEAVKKMYNNYDFYTYYAGTPTVMVCNSVKNIIKIVLQL